MEYVDDMELISIEAHLDSLTYIQNVDFEFHSATNLLEYASGINGIDYSAASMAGMYCHGMADFEREQEKVLTPYLTQLSIFTVLWMALESIINELKKKHSDIWPKGRGFGKIGNLCNFLKKETDSISIPDEYIGFLAQWRDFEIMLASNAIQRKDIPNHVSQAGEGVYRVYKLRNYLFHGDFSGYLPDDKGWAANTGLLEVGSRIIAFTIQMTFMATFKHIGDIDCLWHSSLCEEKEEESMKKVLEVLHLRWV